MHEHDHVTLIGHRDLLSFQLPYIPRILLNLIDEHVKHGAERFSRRGDHVKLYVELLCSHVITSNTRIAE